MMVNLRGVAAIGLGLLVVSPAQAAVLYATSVTIDTVWKSALAGDTIKLSGTFGYTRLQYRSWASAVTLDATKAVFTDTLQLKNVDGLKIVGGTFGATTGTTRYGRAVVVYGGSNISFSKPVVVGSGIGEQGIAFNDTVNASVYSGKFSNLWSAVAFTRVTGGVAKSNTITGAISDGINIGDSHNVRASYNNCSAGAPAPGAHPDCIQLWSVAGHPVQSDITVDHNTATGPTQGFTSFDPDKGGGLRIKLTHNSVFTTYSQGIACYGCIDSNISYNNVATMPGAPHLTNINIIGGSNNYVAGNTIGAFPVPLATLSARSFAAETSTFLDDGEIGPSGSSFDVAASGSDSTVPEPAAWMLMITGFAAVGGAARRSRRYALA